jgi:acyl-coenzyme A thioesterase PaaI-like protein
VAIQLDSHFIAAAKEGQRLEGKAWIIRRTAELAFVEGELWAGGRQTMRASGIWKYLSKG